MLAPTQLSPNGPTFSRLVAGVMTWGVWGHQLETKDIRALIDTCLELGITTFDHADIYGHYTSEGDFGAALREAPSLRDQLQLVTKCGIGLVTPNRPENRLKHYNTSSDYIVNSVEHSLTQLHTDHVDLLLIHRPDPLLQVDEVAEAVVSLKQQGKVLHFGVSNFTPRQFDLLRSVTPLVTNQVEVSVLQSQALFDGTLDQLQQYRLRPMAWSPLGGLFNREDAAAKRVKQLLTALAPRYNGAGADALLLAWLLRHPAGLLPVIGTARPDRLKAATRALEIEMDRQDWFALLEAARGEEVA
ncbi:MAG: aldo/keto reductase [Lewinella sp.]|nr:aldo/keto reductase [Lewinella sp.]